MANKGETFTSLYSIEHGTLYVTPHHQMRHKSEIQKLRFEHNVIDENIGLKMVKELCFYHK